jgi:alpha-L-rhamnosidase
MAELHLAGQVLVATDTTWEVRSSNTSRLGDWGKKGFGGEAVDANLDVPGWDTPAVARSSAGGSWEPATVYSIARNISISADAMEPTVRHSSVAAASVVQLPGKQLITMEELYTGWFEVISMEGAPNSTVRFQISTTHGLDEEFSMVDSFTFGPSGKGSFRMRFAYHEIRYITVTGLASKLDAAQVLGWRLSVDLAREGEFECSSSLMNEIYTTTVRNYLGLTTGGQTVDCPHRERRGYGGDGVGR